MNDNESHRKPASDKSGADSKRGDPLDATPGDRRREPVFTDFDEDEDYEESDRDTDYASAYEEDSEDDEYLEPLEDEEPDDVTTEWQVLGDPAPRPRDTGGNPWDVKDPAGKDEEDEHGFDDEEAAELASAESDLFEDDELVEDESLEGWDEEEEYPDDVEDYEIEHEERAHSWPLGLVIVGVVALVLLAAGGYGVIQQRSATQEEIRQLQATLATAANPAEVAANREALREMEELNTKYQATIDNLTLENRRLTDIVTGLEKQLASSKAAAPRSPAPKPAPARAAPAKTAPKPASATGTGGDWFVNFSSYAQRSVAEDWARKLRPSAGRAVVAVSTKDGKTFYRVRIVGLADRTQAQKVAGQLASAYKLPPLWVGAE